MRTLKVLSTKKLQPSLLRKAKANGIEIIEKDFIHTVPVLTAEKQKEVEEALHSGISWAAFTSANAVEALRKLMQERNAAWTIASIDGRTKEEIEKEAAVPLGTVEITAPNAAALAGRIIEKKADAILFFCGDKRRDELPEILERQGIDVKEIVVYRTIETPSAVQEEFDAILFFSPSGVKSFFSANRIGNKVCCFAIGATTATGLKEYTDKIYISRTASAESMLDALTEQFKMGG